MITIKVYKHPYYFPPSGRKARKKARWKKKQEREKGFASMYMTKSSIVYITKKPMRNRKTYRILSMLKIG